MKPFERPRTRNLGTSKLIPATRIRGYGGQELEMEKYLVPEEI